MREFNVRHLLQAAKRKEKTQRAGEDNTIRLTRQEQRIATLRR